MFVIPSMSRIKQHAQDTRLVDFLNRFIASRNLGRPARKPPGANTFNTDCRPGVERVFPPLRLAPTAIGPASLIVHIMFPLIGTELVWSRSRLA